MTPRRGLLALLPLAGCTGSLVEETAGTPIAPLVGTGFAALHADNGGRPGPLLGSAVAVAPGRVACTSHVLPRGDRAVWLRRGDGAPARRVPVLARSPRMDLSILGDGEGLLAPARICERLVAAGDPIWAAGMPGIGAKVAAGAVEIPDAILPRFGRGFTARMAALMGYSGGPVVGPDGRLRGLVAALPDGATANMLALLSGLDLGGLAAGRDRRVFILSIHEVTEEASRLEGVG
ncbi:trypsin-like peptidase domain-containing protein [Roseomonas sp. SSH11]|uniref:Trypsin-like peptidase domain-containing protein n=1 Tax=Pararoseomonas baculiformis TaxID=2820812 RepID=A0ABS4AJK4_9PROT|nr:trypsin-like peptidase domain-containing protein [Pararoseomonas baculiformis]MBP0447200.1 trypsin-like peptidase domain-containing protein [Pararoseomonas baculiformis]